mgnify:CR=1 FL=1
MLLPGPATARIAPTRDSFELVSRPRLDITPIVQQLLDTEHLPLAYRDRSNRYESILEEAHRDHPQDFPRLLDALVFPESAGLPVHIPEEFAWETAVLFQQHPEWLNRGLLEKLALKQDPTGEVSYTRVALISLLQRGEHAALKPILQKMVALGRDQASGANMNSLVESFCLNLANQPEDRISVRQLWELSKEASRLLPEGETGRIEDFAQGMKTAKQTDRNLQDYQQRLAISEEDLQSLSGKRLCLVGGGNSPLKTGLLESKVDCHVTNIDPIFTEFTPGNEDRKVPLNFFDEAVGTLFRKEKFDEIWALNSLPQYAMSPQETLQFYMGALSGLSPKGILRVAPYTGFSDSLGSAMSLSRPIVRQVSKEVVDELAKNPKLFNVQRFTVTSKGFWGRRPMEGVSIQVVGKPRAVEKFLRRTLPARVNSLCD